MMNKKLNFKNLKQSYDKNGFIVLKNVLNKDDAKKIKNKILFYFNSSAKNLKVEVLILRKIQKNKFCT